MTLSMYQASAPVFDRMLGNLAALLTRAASWAETRKIDPAVLLASRLAPDMFPLTRQVQIACDYAKAGCSLLAGSPPPRYEDTETNLAELQARIARTRAHVATFAAAQLDGSEERQVRFKAGPREMEFQGMAYLTNYALPNFYFHYTMVYAILRHNGMDLGKADFIGR